MQVTMIVNPASGRGRGPAAAQAAAAVLRAGGWEVETVLTAAPGEATVLARQAAAHADVVLVCGGDGTFSEAINGLRDLGVPAGLIPAGTGNDLARALGLSPDPAAAAAQLLGGRARAADLLAVDHSGAEPFHLVAINIIGVGFDAAVAARMNRQTRRTGSSCAYLSAVLLELLAFPTVEVKVTVDGEQWAGRALFVVVANSESYGSGMRIAPVASVTDGLLDVVVVEPMSRLRFLHCLPRVFRGAHLTMPEVHYWQGREVAVETTEPSPALVDGDVKAAAPLTVRVLPGKALLWLPA